MTPNRDLATLLRTLQPVLHPATYAFCVVSDDGNIAALAPLGTFREAEGLTVIVEESVALAHGLPPLFRAAWITLTVSSDLAAVGLTAAVSRVLADAGISCNVVAAAHHDHLFVPVERGADAMAVLRALQDSSGLERSAPSASSVLDTLLDSWDRSNRIVTNLLKAIPPGGLDTRATPDSPTVAALFMHLHYVRLAFVEENAPESARELPADEWGSEPDIDRMTRMLNDSAQAVRDAVKGRIEAGREMDQHYDHPILGLQHLLWHEGYHHGQIKIALKLAGQPLPDDVIGPLSWSVWMRKTR
jgi:uncharacterized damage-inducible protein DinB